jgi:hypothetical protein
VAAQKSRFHDEMFYHATSRKNLKSIVKKGIKPHSYWTNNSALADYYAETIEDDDEEPVIIGVRFEVFDENFLNPDFPGIDEPISTAINKNSSIVYHEWETSNRTWEDSLDIIGSICYHQSIMPLSIFIFDINGDMALLSDKIKFVA